MLVDPADYDVALLRDRPREVPRDITTYVVGSDGWQVRHNTRSRRHMARLGRNHPKKVFYTALSHRLHQVMARRAGLYEQWKLINGVAR